MNVYLAENVTQLLFKISGILNDEFLLKMLQLSFSTKFYTRSPYLFCMYY